MLKRNNIKYIINGVRVNIARAIERNDVYCANMLTSKLKEFRKACEVI